MATWRERLRPPAVDGIEPSEQATTAHALLVAGSAILSVTLLVSAALRPLPVDGHAAYFLMLLAHLLTIVLVRRGVVTAAIVGFTIAYVGVVVLAMARGGGTLAPAGFVLPPIVLFAGLTLSGRGAIATAAASSVAVLGLVLLERRGALPATAAITPIRVWLVATTSLVITGVMLHAALRIIRESRADAAAAQAAQQEIQERLLQSRRLEAVGRLAAGVAHDFNNVLTVVFAEAARLARGDARTAASAGHIREAAERAAALTRQLLSFGRRQVREPEWLAVSEVSRQLEQLLGRFVGDDIRLVIDTTDGGATTVRADRTELEQVLLNLVTNARDAMPGGGLLTLRTGVASAALRARCPTVLGAGAVYLSVTDDGVGIDPAVRARLFEPFFTTKEIGKGTGLGLATVHSIVTGAGGAIVVDSELGTGSTFTVVLPAAGDDAVARALSPPAALVAARPADIIVVDDDALVRGAMHAIVTDGGHAVTVVGTAAEALAAAARWTRPPDLLVTDVIMADMSGPELARRLRVLHPGLRVLFTSGYAEDRLSERGVMVDGVHFVAKPFERTRLLEKIAAVLASDNLGATGPAAPPRE